MRSCAMGAGTRNSDWLSQACTCTPCPSLDLAGRRRDRAAGTTRRFSVCSCASLSRVGVHHGSQKRFELFYVQCRLHDFYVRAEAGQEAEAVLVLGNADRGGQPFRLG